MTNEVLPVTPFRVDLRTLLEALSSMFAFILPAVVSIGLSAQYELLLLLTVGAALVFITRLLGKNATDAVADLSAKLDQVIARNTVLASAATPSVIKKADEAAEAIRVPMVTPEVK